MTGQYNVRNYTRFARLNPGETTFANHLRAAGYATCRVGKWQLGVDARSPGVFGFDDYCLWQFREERKAAGGRDTRYSGPVLSINSTTRTYSRDCYGPDLVTDHARIGILSRVDGRQIPPLANGHRGARLVCSCDGLGRYRSERSGAFQGGPDSARGVIRRFVTTTASLGARLFPHARFAQFNSAAILGTSLLSVVFPLLLGKVPDLSGRHYQQTFFWGAAIAVIALIGFIIVHAYWIKLGGLKPTKAPAWTEAEKRASRLTTAQLL
jgi:hypothetical protein